MSRFRFLLSFTDLFLITAGFVLSVYIQTLAYDEDLSVMITKELAVAVVFSILTFWVAIQRQDESSQDGWLFLFRSFCWGTGTNLIVQALLAYGLQLRRTLVLVLAGGMLASIFLTLARKWIYRRIVTRGTGVLVI